MHTRTDYLAGVVSHEDYYAQFVTPALCRYVEDAIGRAAILASADPHMNDIPLGRWDNLRSVKNIIDAQLFKAANNTTYNESVRDKFIWSLGDQVCIAKAAARAIRREAFQGY